MEVAVIVLAAMTVFIAAAVLLLDIALLKRHRYLFRQTLEF